MSDAAHQAQADVRAKAAEIGGNLRQGAQALGFKNLGEAVSTAVHHAQEEARNQEAEAEDREVGNTRGNGTPGSSATGSGSTTTSPTRAPR